MADRNTYLRYKRDQRLLVYWIAHTSNQIIKTSAPKVSAAINTTGEVSLATLRSLSELIAEHIKPIPQTIFRLFQSIIEARKETHSTFLRIVASNPDPDIQKNNDSHKHWINGLTEAFNALGGESWLSQQRDHLNVSNEDEEEVIFANKFSSLSLDKPTGENQDDEDEDDDNDAEPGKAPATMRPKKKPAKKGKKGKRGRKPKASAKAAGPPPPSLDEVPLESYRIIEDETGIITDYLMAIYSFAQQWIELRHYLQGVWRDVAYKNLNSAVAATLSNIAIGMIKDTQSQIFVDFPGGHDSFETIMKTITRGDPDKAQGMFTLKLVRACPEGHSEVAGASAIDVREELMINCYQDLVDFITDFHKTRSGKPTKAMAKAIQSWDPQLDLQRATAEERLKWRRAYTINWLYDLVNLNSSIVVQRRTMKGQDIPLESVDWSPTGPWNVHRRLFGITEFAGVITHFAWQKPGTGVLQKILPHHVFQLQCIVDSLAVSRGWSVHIMTGHVLGSPAAEFRPRRDVDCFVDRNNEKAGSGYCIGVDILTQLLQKDAMLHGDPRRHESFGVMLRELRDDFVDWLGETKYMHGLKTIPPSRFSHVNTNGLWEYSPFLCGAGLMEALELAYGMGLSLWDRVIEPTCIIHLHNMLVQKGYISRPVGLYYSFEELFRDSFFADGNVPTSNFVEACKKARGSGKSRRENVPQQELRRQIAKNAVDLHGLWAAKCNRFFQEESLVRLLRAAGWVPERIPDEDILIPSCLGLLRVMDTKRVIDPVTGRVAFEDTDLVKRARSSGFDDAGIMALSSNLSSMQEERDGDPKILEKIAKAYTPEGYTSTVEGTSSSPNPSRRGPRSTYEYLEAAKVDITNEICGDLRPLLSVNYVTVLARFMLMFMDFEDELKKRRNPSWVQAYENPLLTREKRLSLTAMTLSEKDEECMQVVADVFEKRRSGFMDHIYWDDLQSHGGLGGGDSSQPIGPDDCTVM